MADLKRVAYRPAQAAEAIGVSRRTVYNWINDDLDPLPSFKVGAARMIWSNKLIEFLERKAKEAA